MRLSKRHTFFGLICALFMTLPVTAVAAANTEDTAIERLVTCQDSWFEWQKSNLTQLKKLGDHFRAAYTRKGNDPYFVPKSRTSIEGLTVVHAFPDSVGMGVGFSVLVEATFDQAKKTFEQKLKKPLQKCETSDGMRTCELGFTEKRTFMLMSGDDPKASQTLVGCYYFYEK